jgi:hypothetical protein
MVVAASVAMTIGAGIAGAAYYRYSRNEEKKVVALDQCNKPLADQEPQSQGGPGVSHTEGAIPLRDASSNRSYRSVREELMRNIGSNRSYKSSMEELSMQEKIMRDMADLEQIVINKEQGLASMKECNDCLEEEIVRMEEEIKMIKRQGTQGTHFDFDSNGSHAESFDISITYK